MHAPVLVAEVIRHLAPARGGLFVDCTLGAGGHTRALLDAGASRVLAFDRDRTAFPLASAALEGCLDRVEMVHADYRRLGDVLDARGLTHVDGGILADLGVSSMQLDDAERGFSFRADAPLDMRMDRDSGPTAATLLQTVEETALADVIYQYGEERFSRRIARAIVRARELGPLETTGQLAAIVRRAVPTRGWQRIDPATRTFQALRIWVNRELEGLDVFIRQAVARLAAGARLAIIAFHSLEDRIVKHTFRALAQAPDPLVSLVTRRPIEATEDEIARNPRARSAKLRVAERLA
ncbi:ribosomal RNA small subunit methyltransferase H [Luteitalea sp. TBR-22]|uniref:16S rRNA (cytosine(1402)-N(4))-methyltransferase RsmH n=1 Tax=Luteitalea sp. TBR-22 TaxID=2802971 RepID=UPI001AF6D038|nr:16S rRNA (cytosine(1402)-N(4))-methyltransferase RsmH [Luteitalea sp. TBR-22]BCS35665.1 ribosomal RNA small subunit methyltransferase H [Luteitalea sp. TBR-22]